MKKIIVLFVMLVILFTAVSAAQAQETVWVFLHWPQDTYTFSQSDDATLAAGWIACTPGLVKTYVNSLNMEFVLDGEVLYETQKRSEYWQILPWEESQWYFGPLGSCVADPNENHASFGEWYYVLPKEKLEVGTHYLYMRWWLDHRVTDGSDYEEPFGELDFFEGIIEERTFTLIVTE